VTDPILTEKFIISDNLFFFKTFSSKPEGHTKQIKQVHGREVLSLKEVNEETPADGVFLFSEEVSTQNQSLNILTADCLPIALMSKSGMALIHAGWKGLRLGILKNPNLIKLNPSHAFLGPHIRKCCYEFSKDFFDNFPKSSPYFPVKDALPHFCLETEATNQLKSTFLGIKVSQSTLCTSCSESLNSFRRNKTSYRNWNILEKSTL
jgi:polyphenol oxidase